MIKTTKCPSWVVQTCITNTRWWPSWKNRHISATVWPMIATKFGKVTVWPFLLLQIAKRLRLGIAYCYGWQGQAGYRWALPHISSYKYFRKCLKLLKPTHCFISGIIVFVMQFSFYISLEGAWNSINSKQHTAVKRVLQYHLYIGWQWHNFFIPYLCHLLDELWETSVIVTSLS